MGQSAETFNAKLTEILGKSGINFISNLEPAKISDYNTSDLAKIDQRGEILLDKMDGLIIEGSYPNPEIGYLIAFGLSRNKPILFLIQKGKTLDPALRTISQDKKTAQYLKLKYYSPASLEKVVLSFLNKIEGFEGIEIPTIKFTLRLTPGIDRYLNWKSQKTGLSKADFLRDTLNNRIIKSDDDYRKFNGQK